MVLQLRMTIWAPTDTTPHVIDHEQGHSQISEYYYQTADKLAERFAESFRRFRPHVYGQAADLCARPGR